jgi:hypothetical protein
MRAVLAVHAISLEHPWIYGVLCCRRIEAKVASHDSREGQLRLSTRAVPTRSHFLVEHLRGDDYVEVKQTKHAVIQY